MILLDTNVVSAMMRLDREPLVADWMRSVSSDELFTSAPTIFELRFGIEKKPRGRRRQELQAAFEQIVGSTLDNRVLPLDFDAAVEAGRIHDIQRRRGRNVSIPDSQIAAIASTLKVRLATRDIDDFKDLGIDLINPWVPADSRR